MKIGRVKYARNGDVRLAYRELGEGDVPIVLVPGWVSNVDLYEDPTTLYAGISEGIARHARMIVWDKRGTGLSDPVSHVPPIDERMDDLRAVLDAADVEYPALVGVSEGGPMSILFAATYPERVRSLLLVGTTARFSQDLPGRPWGLTPEQIEAGFDDLENHWGEGALADLFFGPEVAAIPGVREMWGKEQRASASPMMARLMWQAVTEIDVRDVLGSVLTPTLVLGRQGDRIAPVEAARELADRIPNARLRELPPGEHYAVDLIDLLPRLTLEFVGRQADAIPAERVLSTVLFTDIVGSTEMLAAQGDDRWRRRLDDHDRLVDAVLARYGGRRAKHTGDGIFALFDGPTKAARCGLDLVPALATHGIPIRAGVHIGECEKRGDEWSGMAVHVGARIGAMAGAGEVLTSRTVRDLSVGSGLIFEDLGSHRLKGLPDDTEVFRVKAA
ncbi:adenylate/guanylate cyclase domain-containing protein [Mycolicibacterium sp. 120270]|uniref:adenylate/guanylate cyclase domain-containing protein n=1 Tax=Mycolicibacterium sp. 120270 TaxID=3090600 RepID=UPI00299F30D4|nr:adenylate/guanylate cyclase domain-containing protein [Mycolicibacterium sp. 120270]MDX1886961.1 adenylate/guanylate cyclase domain-containing protein [Mycolicibacterium sp. 120270]